MPYVIFISLICSGCGMDFQSRVGSSLDKRYTGQFYKINAAVDNPSSHLKSQVYEQSFPDIHNGKESNPMKSIAIFFVILIITMIAVAAKKILSGRIFVQQDSDYREDDTEENYNDYENKTDLHRTPYEILNVSSCATLLEIKSAYRKLATQYHPDKVACLAPDFEELANRKMKEINIAYETLSQNV